MTSLHQIPAIYALSDKVNMERAYVSMNIINTNGAVHQRVGKLLYWVSRQFKQQAHFKKKKKKEQKNKTDNQDQRHNITVRVIKKGFIKCPQTLQM